MAKVAAGMFDVLRRQCEQLDDNNFVIPFPAAPDPYTTKRKVVEFEEASSHSDLCLASPLPVMSLGPHMDQGGAPAIVHMMHGRERVWLAPDVPHNRESMPES